MSTAGLERLADAVEADPLLLDRYRDLPSVGALAARLREDGYDVTAADIDACRTATGTGHCVLTFGAGLRLALPKAGPILRHPDLDALFTHLQRCMGPPGNDTGEGGA
ncbi:Nif11-like leader peptide family natural product precursor [Azospirillum halopraeferens]|uniref:Nif11-like leader peptide family natural product precursor n=1 Tax=Azospirillum halopraeferens TaxID=34010 RepID=UPI00048BD313|nr:Nif11-like leader peptide family natural product precursor [Azospirillum halopraeferens]